ncbi:MAG: hypothetical protein Unbinned5374contig1001_21 [Prokaryotic dsDNA virus sp.]|jgi:hypothetical protein|nr:MAG: hypothetical protein Unbinned5374contig1001_21 [Prokaryotic dsDNA virus sp.]|tara:strand:- start:128 stop:322 length:195 start_codon:yes stop_codon:yes gene_type:complete
MSIFTKVAIKDLQILRKVVRTQHMKHYPSSHVNDTEADRIIESLSDNAREKLIKLAVDYGITKL